MLFVLSLPMPFFRLFDAGNLWRFFWSKGRGPWAGIFSAAEEAPSFSRPVAPMGVDADAADVQLFQAGKEAGFNRLVLRHKDKIFTLCFRLLGDRDEALDLAQDVFVRAHRGLVSFRGEARFSTWLHTIAVHACRNRQSSADWRQRRKTESLDTAEERHESMPGGGDLHFTSDAAEKGGRAWSSGAPEQDLLRHRREKLLQSGLLQLPSEFREALVLRDVEGRSYEDIAALAHLEIGTVKSRINRAREKMRDWLKERWE